MCVCRPVCVLDKGAGGENLSAAWGEVIVVYAVGLVTPVNDTD